MEVVRGIQALSRSLNQVVLTIGNFDGVHLGHQTIIRQAVEKARAAGGTSVAYTFRPHPQVALRPGADVQLLSTYDEKLELLGALGVDVVVEEPFSREFSVVAPEQFYTDTILRRLSARAIVVGYDFAFGRERAGHLDALREWASRSGVELSVVQPQRVGDEVVSSSRVRQHLLAGEIEKGNALLGREFCYRGVVVKGEGRGRKLGFPTANLKLENKLRLPYGVYATRALWNGQTLKSVTNVGVRPTFEGVTELGALVETHILDFSQDLYGSPLDVRFVKRLRPERKFPGLDALKAQIALDAEEARTAL